MTYSRGSLQAETGRESRILREGNACHSDMHPPQLTYPPRLPQPPCRASPVCRLLLIPPPQVVHLHLNEHHCFIVSWFGQQLQFITSHILSKIYLQIDAIKDDIPKDVSIPFNHARTVVSTSWNTLFKTPGSPSSAPRIQTQKMCQIHNAQAIRPKYASRTRTGHLSPHPLPQQSGRISVLPSTGTRLPPRGHQRHLVTSNTSPSVTSQSILAPPPPPPPPFKTITTEAHCTVSVALRIYFAPAKKNPSTPFGTTAATSSISSRSP